MKKYILLGGVIAALPTLLALLLKFLTNRVVFDFILGLLTLPTYFLPSLFPNFGAIGFGDVTGFVYLSAAIRAVIYYFCFGMLIGYIVYRFKK